MNEKAQSQQFAVLIGGDLITFALVTLFGFASHRTLETAGFRIFITYLPLLIGWLATAPFIGAYNLELVRRPSQLWRPFWAMVIAAPFAAWLRGVGLNTAIQPLFVLVFGGIAALGILAWRFVFIFWAVRRRSS